MKVINDLLFISGLCCTFGVVIILARVFATDQHYDLATLAAIIKLMITALMIFKLWSL